jgi:hypothetical protein
MMQSDIEGLGIEHGFPFVGEATDIADCAHSADRGLDDHQFRTP